MLRQQPSGDGGQLAQARRLREYRAVRAALADGQLGSAAAAVLTAQLDRLPEHVEEPQLLGGLANGLPQVLDVAFGGTLTREQRTEQQRQLTAELDQVVRQARGATPIPPAQRLEPAFVLLGRALPVGHLAAATAQLLDALAPQAVADRAEQGWRQRSVRLVKKRFEPGWRLIADLTDEHGAALNADLDTRIDAAQAAPTSWPAASAREEEPEQDAAADRVQDTGPQPPPHVWETWRPPGQPPPSDPVDGGTARTDDQRRYDALMAILADAVTGRGRGRGSPPASLLVTCTLQAFEGRAGALPGTLQVGRDSISLTPQALRRLSCTGVLSAVLLDAAGTPVGGSSSRRHATERQRSAIRARQGSRCATNACPNVWTVPHHVVPFHRSRQWPACSSDFLPQVGFRFEIYERRKCLHVGRSTIPVNSLGPRPPSSTGLVDT